MVRILAAWLAAAAVMSLCRAQAPLYAENQHTKFFFGLAAAGQGRLSDDWLASTADPLPVFSWIVATLARNAGPWAFHAVHDLLLGTYLLSLVTIGGTIMQCRPTWRKTGALAFALVLLHSSAAAHVIHAMGIDVGVHFPAGVAGQYLLGHYLQPAVFGVLILAGIALWLRDRPWTASLMLGGAAAVHPAYALTAATVAATGSAMLLLNRRRLRTAAGSFILFSLVVLPTMAHSAAVLKPTSAEAFHQAQSILAHQRMPGHSEITQWLARPDTVWKLALIALAIAAARPVRLRVFMAALLTVSVLLTVLQAALGSDALANLAPWRISATLVPLALVTVLAPMIDAASSALAHHPGCRSAAVRAGPLLAAGLLLGAMLFAAVRWRNNRREREVDPARPMMLAIRDSLLAPSHCYLIPPGMLDFRLTSGAAAFVTFKTHPVRDVEVLAWHERLRAAESFFSAPPDSRCEPARLLASRFGVTHIVLPASEPPPCPAAPCLYADARLAIWRLSTGRGDGE